MDSVTVLLRSSILRDFRLARSVFKFAIAHSSNALAPKVYKRRRDEPVPVQWIFDWLIDLAHELGTPSKWKVFVLNDTLWITKSFCINLAILRPIYPKLVQAVLDAASSATTFSCRDGLKQVLCEMDMIGSLFYHILHDPSFASPAGFMSRNEFIRHLFQHARVIRKPLVLMELLFHSTSASWCMRFNKPGTAVEEPPWNRVWREPPHRLSRYQKELAILATHCITFNGQRHFAFDFFEGAGGVEHVFHFLNGTSKPSMSKAQIKGAWVLAMGKNRHVKNRLLPLGLFSGAETAPPWVSFVYPWADHGLFEGASVLSIEGTCPQKVEALQKFFIVAAIIDSASEALDCPLHVWMQNKEFDRMFLETKPHLKHIKSKLEFLYKNCSPPEYLAFAVMKSANVFFEKHRVDGAHHSPEDFKNACDVKLLDFDWLYQQLHSEACFSSANDLSKFYKSHENESLKVCVFEKGSQVSWLDIVHTHKHVWSQTNDKNKVMVARTARRYFIVATSDFLERSSPLLVYSHPFSLLQTVAFTGHPLWSAGHDLLELCI
jgi:hypothetical protein